MKKIFNGLKLSFSFLTILPIKSEYNNTALNYSLYFYPAVGYFTGIILFFTVFIFKKYISNYIFCYSIFLLLAENLISNFLHIDGFCDCVDALYFTKPGKDKLNILKDPHIGTYAVVWLIILILLKLNAYYIILEQGRINLFLIFPALGYLIVPYQSFFLEPIFNNGLGNSLKSIINKKHLIINTITTFGISLFFFNWQSFIIIFLFSFIIIFFVIKIIKIKFNGYNGDTLGFGIEILKLFILYFFILMIKSNYV